MFNQTRLKEILVSYKRDFIKKQWPDERYKWEAVKWFQDHWDINAKDFAEMLTLSLSRTANLLASGNNFPALMIERFAKMAPEEVRSMFLELFDETKDVYERIESFKQRAGILLKQYVDGAKQHYQNENSICTYLWLRYPDRYYIYKLSELKILASELECNYQFKKGAYAENIRNFLEFYNEICAQLRQDEELVKLLKTQISDGCYEDPKLHTLTNDVGFYISHSYRAAKPQPVEDGKESTEDLPELITEGEQRYWLLNANPKIWSFSDIDVGEEQSYTLYNDNGHKRRIFQNFLDAKVGDVIIGYESTPVKQIVAIARVSAEQDGERICFRKVEGLASPIDYAMLRECTELEKMEYFSMQQGSLFKLTKKEYECIMDMIREENPVRVSKDGREAYSKEQFLEEVYMPETRFDRLVSVLRRKKNVILQGAPGVGKTFAAKRLAYAMMGEKDESRIEFVQFHQSYSYEDFVMGYKPAEEGFKLEYGTFYRFCKKAENHPDRDYFFIIDEINRGNMSKIFGELLMLIEDNYRGVKATLAYNGLSFSVPERLYIIGMMNTADRSLAMIDYALRRRFSFFDMEPSFDSKGFIKYQESLANDTFDELIFRIKELNQYIAADKSLGKGFCIGHSYFCGAEECTDEWMQDIVEYDILPMLREYWFDDNESLQRWENILRGVFQ